MTFDHKNVKRMIKMEKSERLTPGHIERLTPGNKGILRVSAKNVCEHRYRLKRLLNMKIHEKC